MIATIKYNNRNYTIDLKKPLDLSIPIDMAKKDNINAWYVGPPSIKPFTSGNFIASVAEGADINFNDIFFNPHAHITHTECVGHITPKVYSVHEHLQEFFFLTEVITIAPELQGDDFVISKRQLQFALGNKKRDAVVIRTLPNTSDKKTKQYSHTNPPYLLAEAAAFLREKDVQHLLVDLPSVDKEKDDGALAAHHAFWDTDGKIRLSATITEFIFVSNSISDGTYFLNLMVAPFENDASPSRPILYAIETS